MPERESKELSDRIERLEKSLRFGRAVHSLSLAFLAVLTGFVLRGARVEAQDSGKILRVRGIVVEDSSGRSRILLGAPAPGDGRKRQDRAIGLIVLGEDGADRVTVGYTPAPQIGGRVSERIAPGVGITVSDSEGNERGGFGYLDLGKNNGRVVLGLDRPSGEGVVAAVDDEDGSATFKLNYRRPAEGIQGTMAGVYAVADENDASLELVDRRGKTRATLGLKGGSPALKAFDEKGRILFDVFTAGKH